MQENSGCLIRSKEGERLRQMKDSGIEWIGEIPNSWTITILSALFSERKCKNSGLAEDNLLSLSYGNIVRKNIGSNEGLLPASFETYNIIEPGNIVFRLTDLQNDKRSLRTGLCKERGIITSAYVTLQIRSDDSPRYMHYLFHTYDLCKVFYGMGDGVRQGMNYEDLKRLRILRPNQDTQRRIADYLDRKCSQIDAIIARQQEVIEKLKAYKLSVITEAVTKGLNPDVPMKDSGVEWIGEIPEHWTLIKATRIIISTQNGLTRRDLDKSTGQIVLKLRNISSTGEIDYEYQNRIELTKQELDTYRLKEGDFLFVRVNGSKSLVGKCAIFYSIGEDVAYNDHIIRVRISEKCMEKFFFWYLLSICGKTEIDLHTSTSAGQYTISGEGLRDIRLVLPPKTEQFEIDAHLSKICSSIDKVILQKQTSIDRFTAYKKSLIYEVVTGKKEV